MTQSQRLLVMMCLGAMPFISQAACTDQSRPFVSPVNGVRLQFVHDAAVVIDRERNAPELMEEFERGFTTMEGTIVYWEPDGKGGERICREEEWKNRLFDGWWDDAQTLPRRREALKNDDTGKVIPAPIPYHSPALQDGNPVLKIITPHYFLEQVTAYSYDEAGRLVESIDYTGDEINANPYIRKQDFTPRRIKFCAIYDRLGRLQRIFDGDGAGVYDCKDISRENSAVTEYSYDSQGAVERELALHPISPDAVDNFAKFGRWSGSGQVRPGAPPLATVWLNERHGLTLIQSNHPNLVPSDRTPFFRGAENYGNGLGYRLPKPVPLSALENDLAGLTKHYRIRSTRWKTADIYEEFMPNSHQPSRRLWGDGGGIFRQENYESGRLVRVINYGGALTDMGYQEDLRKYADAGVLKVTPSSFRVYEYDKAGNESLVEVCWLIDSKRNKLWEAFPWWLPAKDPPPEMPLGEDVYMSRHVGPRCGTPDGTIRAKADTRIQIKEYMKKKYGFADIRWTFDQKDD